MRKISEGFFILVLLLFIIPIEDKKIFSPFVKWYMNFFGLNIRK